MTSQVVPCRSITSVKPRRESGAPLLHAPPLSRRGFTNLQDHYRNNMVRP